MTVPSIVAFVIGLGAGAGDRDGGWPTLPERGAEAFRLDTSMRAAFAAEHPGRLAEARRQVPRPDLPAFDWAREVRAPRVLSQKESPRSGAFAALSAFEWSWAIRNGEKGLPDLAVGPLLDRSRPGSIDSAEPALDDLLRHGTCPERLYSQGGKSGRRRPTPETPYRAIAWGHVGEPGALPAVDRIKRALIELGPVTAGIYLTSGFQSYRGGVFAEHAVPPTGSPPTGHVVTIVGWDDSKGRGGCWKIENSWGDGWGERGYAWVEYGSNNLGHSACWVRAQSRQYELPEATHTRVGPGTEPFPRWPGAKAVRARPDGDRPGL